MHAAKLLLALLAVSASAGAKQETYGKSEAQILAMGEKKWDDFYQAKIGNSTADMVEMNEIFGAAVRHRNDRLAAKANPTVRSRVQKLRKLMADYAATAAELGYNVTGGGTMWSPVSADIAAHTELELYPMLGGKAPKAKHESISTVKRQLRLLASAIETTDADKDPDPNFKYTYAKASLARMQADLRKLAALVKRLGRASPDHVLGFCIDYAKLASGDWG